MVVDDTENSEARDVAADDRIEDNVVENAETAEALVDEAEATEIVEDAKAEVDDK